MLFGQPKQERTFFNGGSFRIHNVYLSGRLSHCTLQSQSDIMARRFLQAPQTGDDDMNGSKKKMDRAFAWAAFLASYVLVWLLISMPMEWQSGAPPQPKAVFASLGEN